MKAPAASNGHGPRRFDWAAARLVLSRAEAALQAEHETSPERARQFLIERAQRLATPPAPVAEASAARVNVLQFRIGGEHYGIESRYLREVSRLGRITAVPRTPGFVLGVMNLRGEMLSLFDLRPRLGTVGRELDSGACVLVLGRERHEMGFVADATGSTADLELTALTPPPQSSRGQRYVRGVTREALVLLDGAALLDDPDLVLHGNG